MKRTRSSSTLVKVAELALAAPQVVAMRTAQMLAAGATPTVRDRAEFSLMHSEKAAAFWESMFGMSRQLMATNQAYSRGVLSRLMRVWMAPWWLSAQRPLVQTMAALPARVLMPTRREQQRAVTAMAATAVAPVHRRATANAKRLLAKAAAPARKRTTKSKPAARAKKR
jgi:hypothetical protein